jgi:hypothetical protein
MGKNSVNALVILSLKPWYITICMKFPWKKGFFSKLTLKMSHLCQIYHVNKKSWKMYH